MKETPRVVVIGGSNGAGKSTCAPKLLRDRFGLMEFANPDSIAVGISAFRPESVAFEAGRVLLARLREMAQSREDFAFESTLSVEVMRHFWQI
jgi:predicted ABC-type ATPase